MFNFQKSCFTAGFWINAKFLVKYIVLYFLLDVLATLQQPVSQADSVRLCAKQKNDTLISVLIQ